jgi:hypothetical protein
MRDQGVNSSRALTLDVSFDTRSSSLRDFTRRLLADLYYSCVSTRLFRYPTMRVSMYV